MADTYHGPGDLRGEIRWNLSTFNRALQVFARRSRDDMAQLAEEEAFRLEADLKEHTPVDTGRARASWHTVLFGQPGTYTYQDNHGVAYDGTLSGAGAVPKRPTIAVVGSNVNYLLSLEAGSSRQAPSGFIRECLTRAEQRIRARLRAMRLGT